MVFMNMGGPSTTDEVGDFLSRLFVSSTIRLCTSSCLTLIEQAPLIVIDGLSG